IHRFPAPPPGECSEDPPSCHPAWDEPGKRSPERRARPPEPWAGQQRIRGPCWATSIEGRLSMGRASIGSVAGAVILRCLFSVGPTGRFVGSEALARHAEADMRDVVPPRRPHSCPEEGSPRATTSMSRLPLAFLENRGQVDARARFYSRRRNGVTAYFTRNG